jgi:hypothetical protein
VLGRHTAKHHQSLRMPILSPESTDGT